MRSNKDSVNYNDDLVSGLMRPLFQVTIFLTFLIMRKQLLLRIRFFGSTLIKLFGKSGSIKFLTVTSQRIPIIWNWCGLIQKKNIGFWLQIVPGNIIKKEFLYQLINIRMEGLWKIRIWYHNKDKKSEKGMTTTEVNDFVWDCFVKLHSQKTKNHFL